ncbi:hypothetical protein ACFO5R_00775 [Halosolutus amylolyticus]|uniref:Uncharacterized protein n=1 Tax=Halosolutus amylolyticus TaxID=2932267 RepID=A0ABD5PIP6_9EURY|nr:hypothetical protein [Halosolutus amylolyticus]
MITESPTATGALFVFGLAALVVVTYRYRRHSREYDDQDVPSDATDVTGVFALTALALLWFLDALDMTTSPIATILLMAAGVGVLTTIALSVARIRTQHD